ncbi:MAG: alpha/beta fold hydrolase, partial [Gammaproteobacteria bacterium]|nr:alpha/beta fold hydrolase [Gammaproteobacteria bacterium]
TLSKAAGLVAESRPELIDCGDGVRLLGYLSRVPEPRGLVVLLHGWEGSADSSYVLSAGSALREAGFSVFRLNFRDHGQTQALNPELFHSCRIDEVFAAVARIRQSHPEGGFAIVGQSLGGNFAIRVALRAPEVGLEIDRVIAVCPVLRPHSTIEALDRGLWIYQRYFLSRWRRSLRDKAKAFPDLYRFGDLRRFPTLTATTDFFVRHYTEFETLDDYLNGYALTGGVLSNLTVPTRMILAADDPVIPIADIDDIARPPALEIETSAYGGHCGFVDAWVRPAWIDRAIVADLDRTI